MLARTNWLGEFLKHGVLLAGAIVVLLPFYLMLSYSLKSPHEIEANSIVKKLSCYSAARTIQTKPKWLLLVGEA